VNEFIVYISTRALAVLVACCIALPAVARASTPDLPVLVREDFESGADRWQPTDAGAWQVTGEGDKHVYNQYRRSEYEPPHRSPYNISLLKDVVVGDFVLTADVRSTTGRNNGHRDVCLFFGYQDPAHFYYVHVGRKTDDHANQIFVVDDADRIKISERTNEGTPWDDEWHRVKVVRDVESGKIEIYFDDMEKPVKVAHDKRFMSGQVGIGSFDDTAEWDNVELRGRRVEQSAKATTSGPSGGR